jgi:hypothetical protein
MLQFPRAQCRSCGAPLSRFALSCAHCGASNQPNAVTIASASAGALVLGAAIVLGVHVLRGEDQPAPVSETPGEPAPAIPGGKGDDYGWIVTAMAECDAEAKQKRDKLRFLIVPVAPTGRSLPGWSPQPISDIGHSGKLLSSTDALLGLRNAAFGIYQKPLTFVVSDVATGTLYKWKPAIGVAALNTSQLFARLKLGFELPDVTDEIEWGPTVNVERDTCYWINPLVLAPTRAG